MDLTGKAAIVTGSASGIGEAVARRLAGAGCGVVINSVRSNETGEGIANELPDAIYVQGDIGDPATANRLVDAAVERWGRLDGLVNNAAMTVSTPLADLAGSTAEQWEQVLRVNVIGTFLVSQAALPHLRANGDGWIVNITSLAGVRQGGSSLPYATSKAAVNHLTALMAKFTGPEVRVNAVAPGLVDTPWTVGERWDVVREQIKATIPLHRSGTPDDITDAVIGLITSRYATGQVLVIDGGTSLVS
ncbi:MAG TPA: SDR family oxidoreductase [Ilumatobacteraceae bacterium]|nr:SDR family oxidoreductase [Ilumatobacteraceae bacterium]